MPHKSRQMLCGSDQCWAMLIVLLAHLSCETSLNSPSRPGATCALNPARSTNCPTVAPNLSGISTFCR